MAYEIYRAAGNRYGQIPGVLGRSEFGLEFVLAVAYQVYVVRLSLDKVCLLMNMLQDLKLRKSRVDALRNQLARAWEAEFDHLCTLLAWCTPTRRVGASTACGSSFPKRRGSARILEPETFAVLLISDDAAVCANFSHAQKCWAHLIRKAIKLTLQEPQNAEYCRFADGLLDVYQRDCRVQSDGRLSDAGWRRKVAELDDALLQLCGGVWAAQRPPLEGPDDDYRLLCNEVMRLMLVEELLPFVDLLDHASQRPFRLVVDARHGPHVAVGLTHRGSRHSAQARVTGRTNKTTRGARRRAMVAVGSQPIRSSGPPHSPHLRHPRAVRTKSINFFPTRPRTTWTPTSRRPQ